MGVKATIQLDDLLPGNRFQEADYCSDGIVSRAETQEVRSHNG